MPRPTPGRRPRPNEPSSPDEVEVRHVQPYQATKSYRCPSCQQLIPVGTGHKVVVPVRDPDLRRHWHVSCWQRQERRWGAAGRAPSPSD